MTSCSDCYDVMLMCYILQLYFVCNRLINFCIVDEYHLFVDQVTLDDDAMFQCQVGPAGGDPPLAAEVKLSVISKCFIPSFLPS